MEVPVPDDDMAPFMVEADGGMFDPSDPAGMLTQYSARLESGATFA
jgi:hypothetical protein